ncbi:MAG TPA: TonB-dependent receptor [Opitutaceae bacterium]
MRSSRMPGIARRNSRWIAPFLVWTAAAAGAWAQEAPSRTPSDDGTRIEDTKAVPLTGSLTPYVVRDAFDKVVLTPEEARLLELYFGPFGMPGIEGLTPNMRSLYVVTPLRMLEQVKKVASTIESADGEALAGPPSATFDGRLDVGIGYSLDGRGVNLPPYPSDQAVNLRGVPSLVVLDGVPAGDPYAGWVNWAAIPREGAMRAEFSPGAGAAAWGDGALGGVGQFLTIPASGQIAMRPGSLTDGGPPDPNVMKSVVVGTGQFAAEVGDFGTRSAEVVASQPLDNGVLQLLGRDFSSEGYTLVSDAGRGPVDEAAWSRHDWVEARWRQMIGKGALLTAALGGYSQANGEGTAYQSSRESGISASLSLLGRVTPDFTWTAAAYAKDTAASGRFSFVNEARTSESPAVDLLSVPATEVGASLSGIWDSAEGSRTTAGIDTRVVNGESREDIDYTLGSFAGRLAGGGEQDDTGLYVVREQKITTTLRATLGARLAFWDESEGHLRQSSPGSGAPLSDQEFPGSDGTEFSPEAGLIWRPSDSWALHANAQQGFSRPTLADLYEPTVHYSTATEPNPSLATEHITSAEAGVEYSFITADERAKHSGGFSALRPPRALFMLGVTAFSEAMRGAVSNVDLSGPGELTPLFGNTPQGYLGRKMENIDRSRIQGLEFSGRWNIAANLSIVARWQFQNPTIVRDGLEPWLAGRQIEMAPRRSGLLSAQWAASSKTRFTARLRAFGAQFQDNENTLRLGQSVEADVEAVYQLSKDIELSLSVENLSDGRLEVSRGTTGVVYTGPPRMAFTGIRLKW